MKPLVLSLYLLLGTLNLWIERSVVSSVCTSIYLSSRVDCHPEADPSPEVCLNRGCCWQVQLNDSELIGLPSCFYPSNYIGYNVSRVEQTSRTVTFNLKRIRPSGLPKDIKRVTVKVYQLNDNLVRVKITDSTRKRFEPPIPKLNLPKSKAKDQLYDITFDLHGQLLITRVTTGKVLFHTDLRKLIFSNQFHQLSTRLPSDHIYGLGEHKDLFRKPATWKKYTLFNRDEHPRENTNLYGSHPFHFSIEDDDGHSSGTFLFNSNAMDVFLSPQPGITYRPIGGILDFFIFVAETPEDLVKSYINLIGLPAMPPLWSLGFHLCKYPYGSLNHTIEVWNRTRNANIPYDVQWNDIDYMKDYNDFTYDKHRYKGLPEFVDEVHSVGMHYVVMLDPGVSAGEEPGTYPPYEDGVQMDIFIKNSSGHILISHTWNRSNRTVYPDFTHPKAIAYWTKQVQRLHNKFHFDGLWIDMNEISSFVSGSLDGCPESELESPPYLPGDVDLAYTTLCMTARLYKGLNYNIHNLYANYEAIATRKALEYVRPGKRPFILSRASFPGMGSYAAHWDGDIGSEWQFMRWTIPSILEFNIFGVPLVGADICGFSENTTVEMCARWSLLGAFYPFSRNHDSEVSMEQDPVIMGPVVVKANKVALGLRYRLLPYLYTLFYRAHIYGETVARPLFFEFPKDDISRYIETQFMWGKALLIAPVLEEGETSVNAYIPAGPWYFVDTLHTVVSVGQYFDFETPIDKINVLLRGGQVIVMADEEITLTKELHDVPFKIVAAMDGNGSASGEFYWDDGESTDAIQDDQYNLVRFELEKNFLITIPIKTGFKSLKQLSSIVILGVQHKPNIVIANGQVARFTYLTTKQVLNVNLSNMKYNIFQYNVITWTY